MKTTKVQLPNGLINEAADTARHCVLSRLTGDQEDMLRDPRNKEREDSEVLEDVLISCIVELGSASAPAEVRKNYRERLVLPDVMTLLIELRRFSLGDSYSFPWRCPACKKHTRQRIDLSKLVDMEVSLTTDDGRPLHAGKDRLFLSVPLEDADGEMVPATIEALPLLARDQKQMQEIARRYKDAQATMELLLQLKLINGGAVTKDQLRKMTWRDRSAIRDAIDDGFGGKDAELKITCDHCDHQVSTSMPIEARSFFFPKARGEPITEAEPVRSGKR